MAQDNLSWHNPARKNFWVWVVVISVVLLALLMGMVIFQRMLRQDTNAYQSAVRRANAQLLSRDYNGAIQTYNGYLNRGGMVGHSWEVKLGLAQTYLSEREYRAAIRVYQDVIKSSDRYKLAGTQGAAIAAQQMGDKTAAISYYQQAIELLKSRPTQSSRRDIANHQAMIKQLKDTP